jgi:Ala-tRNA(Pro) deacylase
MATIAWIKNILERRGIAYEEVHHRPVFTAQELAQAEHVSGHRVAKVVVVMADGHPAELILPASRRVVFTEVARLLNAKEIRLATELEMQKIFSDCEVGAVPALSHWKGVKVLLDEALAGPGEILFQAGTHEDAIKLKFDDWLTIVKPRIDSFSEPLFTQHEEPLRGEPPIGLKHASDLDE